MRPFTTTTCVLILGLLVSAQTTLAQPTLVQNAPWRDVQADVARLNEQNEQMRVRLAEMETMLAARHRDVLAGFEHGASDQACQESCCEPASGLSAGIGLYFLKPHWDNNPAYGEYTGGGGPGESYSQTDFDWNLEMAWDVWLEYVGCAGGGLRARYWQFDHGVSDQPVLGNPIDEGVVWPRPLGLPKPVFGGPVTFVFESGLEMHVVDVEALQRFDHGLWTWEASGGLRWASVRQDYRAREPVFSDSFLSLEHDFDGIGPVLAIEGRRQFCGTGLSLFGKARGAILFGEANAAGAEGSGINIDSVASASRWDTVSVIEFELGATFERHMAAATAFLELAFVGSAWLGAGNASLSSPLAAGAPTTITDQPAFGTSTTENLGLIGGRVSAGVRF